MEKTYLVAHPTEEEAISALRRVYPFETGAKIIAVAMAADQMKRRHQRSGFLTTRSFDVDADTSKI